MRDWLFFYGLGESLLLVPFVGQMGDDGVAGGLEVSFKHIFLFLRSNF